MEVWINKSILDEGGWSASCSGRFAPEIRDPDTHWAGNWVDPRSDLDVVMEGKVSALDGNQTKDIRPED
jgi:hypothetical protein